MIYPGILELNFEEVKRKLELIDDAAEFVQIDIADGVFVEGKTFLEINKLAEVHTSANVEIHLMVQHPSRFVETKIPHIFAAIAHIERKEEMDLFIENCRKNGYRVGIAINPETEIDALWPHAHRIDFVQFMTIHPGQQGQQFIKDVLPKIKKFKNAFPSIPCKVDGGVNLDTLAAVIEAGAEDQVIGSAIFATEDPVQEFKKLTVAVHQSLNKMGKIEKIAFLGGSAWKPEDDAYIGAYEVAKILAENGYQIVNGGGPGVMRASTLGAQAGGGKALAITYHPNKPKRHYEGVDLENTFDEEVKTLDYFDRTKVMLQASDVHIVFNGSIGTMSELGMSWVSSWIHEPNNKPIILYGDFWKHFIDYVKTYMYLKNGEEHIMKICTTPEEVLEYIKSVDLSKNTPASMEAETNEKIDKEFELIKEEEAAFEEPSESPSGITELS